MCLSYSEESTRLAREKHPREVVRYKVILKNNTSIHRASKYKSGWFKSDRESKNLNTYECYILAVNKGIHVYTTLARAKRIKRFHNERKIIKVKCLTKDLVGRNILGSEEVYMKVFVPKEELE